MSQRQQGIGRFDNPSPVANMPLDASASSGISSTAGMSASNNNQGMQAEGEAVKASSINRHHSFAGLRENVQVTYFVDGEEYFSAVADALNEAKEYIFIEDWWMSPQVYLKRPALFDKTWRLDELLKKKAQEGVKVWIVIYKEVNLALALNSRYVKEWMNNLHPNIKVQRHPDHEGENSVLRWAHHEKMVIVDSKIAFVGGLDLCFGRYDSHSHRLADPTEIIWYGQDYNNPRRKDFVNVNDYKKTLIDRQVFPRMPWHDISMKVTGLAAYDVARHFCERWNFVKKVKGPEKTDIPILDPGLKNAEAYAQKVKGTCVTQVLRSSSKWSSGVSHEKSIQNAYLDLINNAEHFIYIENQFFISNPTTKDDYEISNQIANALVKRIFRAYDENKPFRVIVAMPLMPAFESDIDDKNANTLRLVMHWQYTTISRGGNSIFEQLIGKGIRPSDYISFYGLRQYDLIRDKKHYPAPTKEELLKMNQADVEDAALESGRKENHLSAHLPSFITDIFRRSFKKEVEVVEAESSTLTEIRSDLEQDSLYVTELLYIHSKLMIVDDKYVICGSANINDRSMRGDRDSEIAILVEDKSEVNSRMNGQPYKVGRVAQDLRIKIFCEHLGLTPETSIKFLANHGPHYVPHFYRGNDAYMQKIRNLLQDPLSPEFWKLWNETAKENTEIYRRVFHCVPDDNITTWEEYKKFVPDKTKVAPGHVVDPDLNKAQIQQQVHQIQGHLGRPLANHPAFFERTSPPNSPTFKKSPQLIPVSPTFPPPPLIVTSINGEESRLMELQHEDQAVMQLEATTTLNSSQKLWLYEELKLERSVLVIHKMLQASAFIILHKLYGAAIRPFAQWIILKHFKDWDKKVKSKGEVPVISLCTAGEEWWLLLKLSSNRVLDGYLVKANEFHRTSLEWFNSSLKLQKLPLIMDLDNTLVNTVMERDISPSVRDELLKGGNELHPLKSIPGGRICFIPKEAREFLAKLKDLFDIHLCSLGEQVYLNEVGELLNANERVIEGMLYSSRAEYDFRLKLNGAVLNKNAALPQVKNISNVLPIPAELVRLVPVVEDSPELYVKEQLGNILKVYPKLEMLKKVSYERHLAILRFYYATFFSTLRNLSTEEDRNDFLINSSRFSFANTVKAYELLFDNDSL